MNNSQDFEIDTAKRVAFYTLGCKLNYAETSMIASKFVEKGYRKVPFTNLAEVYVINTCSVTQVADKKCRNIIKKATGKGAKVVVIGCYSQLNPDEIAAIEGVDLILGTKEKFKILDYLEQIENIKTNESFLKIHSCDIEDAVSFEASYSSSDRTRAFLKVQDGCDYMCTYCTIPLARGKSRNESIEETLKKANEIAQKDIKEIVLTGVNIGDFGRSTGENFMDLISELEKIEGIARYRISSIEPNLLNDTIIEFTLHSEKFAPHFHIPLQSGSNNILGNMRRRYKRELYAQRVDKIKELIPRACIGGDVIVGFPGETNDEFAETFNFLNALDISYLHVFPYSERKNTFAATLPEKVLPKEKERRVALLMELSEQKRKKFYENNIGFCDKVIFESKISDGLMTGFTSNYIKVEVPVNKNLFGKLAKVRLLKIANSGNMVAEII